MNAQDRVNFIKNIGDDEGKPIDLKCKKCGNTVSVQDRFCENCGAPLADFTADETGKEESLPSEQNAIKSDEVIEIDPAEKLKKPDSVMPKTQTKEVVEEKDWKEPASAFAMGLPSWDLEPPQTVVRRRKI